MRIEKDPIRARLNKYTRKAFQTLPSIEKPRILDIGCGTGVSMLELAGLCDGQIVGVDLDQTSLDILEAKSRLAGFADRISTVRCSLFEMVFPDEYFDVLWAEGSIAVIGFAKGLAKWRRMLKPRGFLAVHDEVGDMRKKLQQIRECGYKLLDCFELSPDTWLTEYFNPLEEHLKALRIEHANDPKALAEIDVEQRQIDSFKDAPRGSVFFIMQKEQQ